MCWLSNLFKPKDNKPKDAVEIIIPTSYEVPSPQIRPFALDKQEDGGFKLAGLPEGSFAIHFADTNSMDPLLDIGFAGIISPVNVLELIVGDIIVYHRPMIVLGGVVHGEGDIIHRITKIGEDAEGWYCLTRGDNKYITGNDPYEIRASWVTGVLRALVW